MSFQTTLTILGIIPTSYFDRFSRTLNAMTLLQRLSNPSSYKELKTWRTQQDSLILTRALNLSNFKEHKHLRISYQIHVIEIPSTKSLTLFCNWLHLWLYIKCRTKQSFICDWALEVSCLYVWTFVIFSEYNEKSLESAKGLD